MMFPKIAPYDSWMLLLDAAPCQPLKRAGRDIVVPPDLDPLVRRVREILDTADANQVRLTDLYIEAGRGLWKFRKNCKQRKLKFKDKLAESFPSRERSTLREYMTLAKYFDAASPETKVQLTGLFKHGWGAVLSELRSLRREEKARKNNRQSASAAPVENLTILNGDSMVRLAELPAESVDCVITSFPYYRRFVFPGATTVFGGKHDCDHDWEISQIIHTPVRPRTAWKNRPCAKDGQVIETGFCKKCNAERVMLGWEKDQSQYVEHVVQICNRIKRVLKPNGVFWLNIGDSYVDKALCLIPQKVAIAISESGWICRQDLIWRVPGRAPDGVRDRLCCTHEYVFMFVKQKSYYFDQSAMRERDISGTVWSIPNERAEGHNCPFPRALVEPMLLSSCPEGGVCLDPMAGTGTTGLVALAHRRKAILIEANPDYCGNAKRRIETELASYKAKIDRRVKPTHGVVSRRRH
jgi:site-specific DNA-methyltransferase (cytosine-N4-specific)